MPEFFIDADCTQQNLELGSRSDPCHVLLEELLSFPAQHLAGLPIPIRIVLEANGIAHDIHWNSDLTPGSQRGAVVFDADEVRAVAIGVQAERLWPADVKGFCLRKLHDPSFRVTERAALDGAQPQPGRAWSLRHVLHWLELELVAAEWTDREASPAESGRLGAAA